MSDEQFNRDTVARISRGQRLTFPLLLEIAIGRTRLYQESVVFLGPYLCDLFITAT